MHHDREEAWPIYAAQSCLARAPFFALPAAGLGLLGSPLLAVSLALVAVATVGCSTFAEHWLQGAAPRNPWGRVAVALAANGALSGGLVLGALLALSDYPSVVLEAGAEVALQVLVDHARNLDLWAWLFAVAAGLPWGIAVANHPAGQLYSDSLPACFTAAGVASLLFGALSATVTWAWGPSGGLAPYYLVLVVFASGMGWCVACLPMALFVLNAVDAFEEWWWSRPPRRGVAREPDSSTAVH